MKNNRVASYVKHYLYGLFASCFNAGISAVKIAGGVSVAAAAAPKLVSAPDLKAMVGIFVAAAFWEMIDYFSDHKLPIALPDAPAALASPSVSPS